MFRHRKHVTATTSSACPEADHGSSTTGKSNQKKQSSWAWVLAICIILVPLLWPPAIRHLPQETNIGTSSSSSSSLPTALARRSSVSQPHQRTNYLKRLPSKDKIPRPSNSTTPATPTTTNTTKKVDYHLVFSTGCSLFQDWQSYAFFYHVQKSGQPGNVTRIVSGCTQTQQQELRQAHETHI